MSNVELRAPPDKWAVTSIGDVAQINPSGSTVTANHDQPVTFLRMAAVEELSGEIDTSDTRLFSAVKKGFTRFQDGDLLFAKITPCMENGKIAVVRDLLGGIGCGSTEFHVIRPALGVEADYLRYYLVQSSFRQLARRNMQGAVGQQRVPAAFVREAQLPLAPSNEQKRIVSKLDEIFSRIDDGERALERVQRLVERYRQSVLKAAVTGELTRAWREQRKGKLESGHVLLQRILEARRAAWEKAELDKMKAKGQKPANDKWKQKYQEPSPPDSTNLPDLPEGWVWASLPQLGYFGRGKSKHRPRNEPKLFGGQYPFLQTGTVRSSNGRITTFDSTYSELGLAQSKLWPKGTICITIAANIAASGILEFDACFPDSVVGLIADPNIVAEYVEFFIRTARESLDRYAPATAQKNINLDILEQVAVPLPPFGEQVAICSKVQEELSKIEDIFRTVNIAGDQSIVLRQATLKSAFSGKLVPHDPTDEPGSNLLKRIAAERHTATKTKTTRGRRPIMPKSSA